MNKRYSVILPLALALLLLVGTAVWGYGQMVSRRAAETALSNKYNLAFYNLVNNLQNMEVFLSKSLVGEETWQDSQIFMQLWQESMAAQGNLGQIPVQDATVARTLKFVNQAGAFARGLAVQTSGGLPKTGEQWQTLQGLQKQARQLNVEMDRVEADLSSGRLSLSELRRDSRWVLRRQGPQLANTNFQAMDRNMQQFPTLIYDGPFSDHLMTRKPLGLEGPQVTPDQARNKALTFLDQQPNVTYIANVARKDQGRIPLYRVEVTPRPARNGETIAIGVSQQAGQVLWMINSRSIGSAAINVSQAEDRAASFLQDRGFRDMESTYYEIRNNMAIYNFAATQGGVILYPDQIKVSVALDNGQVMGVDAINYWMAHRARELPKPALTADQARKKLSPRLEDVTPGRLALIPKTVDQETLAYEFQGRLDSDVFLVYIDAVTGEEERVLRVIRTNNGVLTM
ncbi:MAG: germination protein YpeB [Desulfocucumaceae bacterium]